MKRVFSFLKKLYVALILFFLYAPILTLIVLSFNQSRSRAKWGGFTLRWYSQLFENRSIMQALSTTLFVALVSSLIATGIGVLAAVAIHYMGRKAKSILLGITNIPLLNADIVTGISLMLIFLMIGLSFGMTSVLIAHITFNISYVILSVLPRLEGLSPSIYEAALDLGASKGYAFYKVIIPELLPGIASGFLLAFTMSVDDFIITHFTKGPGIDTLSTKIYTEVRKGIKPEMYSLSTLLFVSVLILLLIAHYKPSIQKEKTRRSL